MKKYSKRILAFLCAIALVVASIWGNGAIRQAQAADTEPTPVELDGFTNVTVGDFVYAGTENPMEEKEYTSQADFQLKEGNDFDQKLFSANVKFTSTNWWCSRICIGGTADNGWGLAVCVDKTSDVLKLAEFDSNIDGDSGSSFEKAISTSTAKVDTFVDKEFLLQIGFEYLDHDNGGTENDVRVLVYVNGNAAFDEVFSNCNMDRLGDYVRFYVESGCALKVGAIDVPEDTTPTTPTPVELDGFTNVTVGDFVYAGTENPMEEKEYTSNETLTLKDGADFNKKLFTAKMKFTDPTNANYWSNRFYIGGTAGNGWGLALCVDGANNVLKLEEFDSNIDGNTNEFFTRTITASTAKVDSFLNTEFILQVGFEYLDNDNGGTANDVRVLVYVDGNAAFNEVFSNCNMDRLGNYVRTYFETEYRIQVGAIDVPKEPDDSGEQPGEDEPTPPTTNYDDVTFRDFGIESAVYNSKGVELAVKGELEERQDLDKIALSGDILLTGASTDTFDFMLGSKNEDVWSGIKLWINGKTMTLNLGSRTNVAILDSETAGVGTTFANNKFTLKWSVEFVCNDNDNQYNDVKVGLWFNGNLYNNEYYTISNGGTAAELGNSFAVCCESANSSITINPDSIVPEPEPPSEPIQPSDELQKVTFSDFGIKDATYTYSPAEIVVQSSLNEKDSLDKTLLCGDVLLDGSSFFQLILGGKENAWDGMRLIIKADGTMELLGPKACGHQLIAALSPGDDDTSFIGEKFNLMWSTEFVDHDGDGNTNDIKAGLWFNGVLYQNKFIIIPDSTDGLGTVFAAACSAEGDSVTLNSIAELVAPPKQPNPDFERITFEYFGAADGTYKYNGSVEPTCEGKGRDTINEKVFCGDFLFTGEGGSQFMIGGNGNTWYGLCFIIAENGQIALFWIDDEGAIPVATYDAVTAGTPLVGEWLNLMISTEILDADGDGAEDDIELGVWFNGVLYKEAFSTILNKASGLGNCFGMYSGKEGRAISIRSIPEYMKGFDYAAFGLTKDWEKTLLGTGFKAQIATGGSRDAEPFTGDLFNTGITCVFGVAAIMALVAGFYIMSQRKKES